MEPTPTTGGPIYKEPAVVIGIIVGALIALLQGVLGLADAGGLDDGLSLNEAGTIVMPVIAGLLIRFKVFSQQTVDLLAPRAAQAKAVEQKKKLV